MLSAIRLLLLHILPFPVFRWLRNTYFVTRKMRSNLPMIRLKRILARRFPPQADTKRPVILFTPHDPGELLRGNWVSGIEPLIAKYLQLRYKARIVFYMDDRRNLFVTPYRAFGFREFIFNEELQLVDEPVDFTELISNFSVDRLKAFYLRGVPLGKLALENTCRLTQKSRIGTPADLSILHEALKDGVRRLQAAEILLRDLQPDVIVNRHTIYIEFGGVLFHKGLEQGKPSFSWQGRDIETIWFRRFYPDIAFEDEASLSETEWKTVQADPNRETYIEEARGYLADRIAGNQPRLPQGEKIGLKHQTLRPPWLDGKTPLVGVFTHLPWDGAGSFFKDLFPTFADWIEATARAALENDHVQWVFRVHPSEANYGSVEDTAALIRAIIPENTPHIHLVDSTAPISSYAMTDQLVTGVTVRGTLAAELPCLGIPVICAGSGATSLLPHNIFPKTPEDYRQTLLNAHHIKRLDEAQIRQALLFAYEFFIHHPVRFECVNNFTDVDQLARLTPEMLLRDRGIARIADMVMQAAQERT